MIINIHIHVLHSNYMFLLLVIFVVYSIIESIYPPDFKHLAFLSCLENPVTAKPFYREYVIHKCKLLTTLDFRRITPLVFIET